MTAPALAGLLIFVVAYALVVTEDFTHLRKSTPLILAAGCVWWMAALQLEHERVLERMRDSVYEFGQVFLFLLVAVTYINAIRKRRVFDWISARLVSKGKGLRGVFWATGAMAFLLSPVADNLTTALVLGAVVLAVAGHDARFVAVACTNIVVAANAGGVFSPFGDLTTLMVWQADKVPTPEFLRLVGPALASWLVPAVFMHRAVPSGEGHELERNVELGRDWVVLVVLFAATIATAVAFHAALHLPPFLGMTTGLGYYMAYCYWDCRRQGGLRHPGSKVFEHIRSVDWDSMLFFFGVILCIGGLRALGHLASASEFLYQGLGPNAASTCLGLVSAVLDNVPVMFAVIGMDPTMGVDGWLLVTLTTGIGGSILSVGSAAGVALMGTSNGAYTFARHLVWTPLIALGYFVGVGVHLLLSGP